MAARRSSALPKAAPALAFLLLAAGGCGRRPPPDVILITIDTLRADALGCYGRRPSPTPTLDALAGQAVRFTYAVTPVPVTLPAHASLLTGTWPRRHGLRNNGMAGLYAAATLAEWLGGRGYATAAFPSAAVLERRFGLERGFQLYDDRWLKHAGPRLRIAERSGGAAVEAACDWWRTVTDRPRFLWLHLFEPHAPYAAPPALRARYADPYLAEVAAADAAVAALLRRTERRDRPALLVVTADHGEGLGEHGEATHGVLLYESTIRVPLLIRAPGQPAGVDDQLISLVDLFPTICALIGITPPDRLDGVVRLGPGRQPRAIALLETFLPELDYGWHPLTGARERRHKLIRGPVLELYDLERDPAERADLSTRLPELARRLERHLAGGAGRFAEGPAEPEMLGRLRALGYAGGAERSSRPDRADPRVAIGELARLERALDLLELGQAVPAEAELLALLEVDPTHRAAILLLVRLLREQGRLQQARSILQSAVAAGDRSPTLLTRLAEVLQDLGQAGAAEPLLEEVLRIAPRRLEARISLAIGLIQQGRWPRAERELLTALRQAPDHPIVLTNLAALLIEAGRPAEAEVWYRKLLGLEPERSSAWLGLGNAVRELGRPVEALQAYRRAFELAPGSIPAAYNYGRLAEEQGEIEAALAAYDRILANPRDPSLAEIRAEILARRTRLTPEG